jgi:hypothetical protein
MVQSPKENLSAGVGVKAMEIAPFSVFDDLLLFRTYYRRMDAAPTKKVSFGFPKEVASMDTITPCR